MSYALASKKRKFHRVLESISNTSTEKQPKTAAAAQHGTSSTSLRPSEPSTIKRVRLSPGRESGDSTVRPSSGLRKRRSKSPSSLRPNYVPWDRNRFLERLQTFRPVDQWSPKPAPINEVQWAKRGWSCTGPMRVECVGGCGHSVVVKLPDDIDELEEDDIEKIEERREVRAKLVEEYQRLIAESHGERCPWRKAGCDDTIQRLQLWKPEDALESLGTRYKNLASLEDKLPSFETLELPGSLDVAKLLEILPPGAVIDTKDDTEPPTEGTEGGGSGEPRNTENPSTSESGDNSINKAAFTLALFGWDVRGDPGAGLSSCGACFRRLGLWMYQPQKGGKEPVYDRLDVVTEHLDYCPWVNAESQSGKKKHAEGPELHSGWKVLEQDIQTIHRRRTWSDESTSRPGSASAASAPDEEIDNDEKKAKDREWWSKIRRLRQSLHVRTPKKAKQTRAAS